MSAQQWWHGYKIKVYSIVFTQLNSKFTFSLQERIEDLKKDRKVVESKMAMAEDELQKTQDLEKMLSNSKMVRLTNCSPHVLFT